MEDRVEGLEVRVQGSAFSAFSFGPHGLISQIVFIKSFCKSPFPRKSVNLFFVLVRTIDKLTDLWES